MRYLVFAHYQYYPTGGTGDMVGTFESEEEAVKLAEKYTEILYDCVEVYDTLEDKNIY